MATRVRWKDDELWFLADNIRKDTSPAELQETYFPHRSLGGVNTAITRAKKVYPHGTPPPPNYHPPIAQHHHQQQPQQQHVMTLPPPIIGPSDRCKYL